MIVLVVVLVYVLCNLACVGYVVRRRGDELNPLLHVVVPLLGVVAFVPALFTAGGVRVVSFVAPLSAPLSAPVSCAGPVVGAWLVLGALYLAWLQAQHPDRVRAMSQVHLVDEVDLADREVAA